MEIHLAEAVKQPAKPAKARVIMDDATQNEVMVLPEGNILKQAWHFVRKHKYYLLGILLFSACLRIGIPLLPTKVHDALLYPYAQCIRLYFNQPMAYLVGEGYAFFDGDYIIGLSCLGNSFAALLVLVLPVCYLHYGRSAKRVWGFVGCILASLLLAGLANTIRIMASAFFYDSQKFVLIHGLIGSCIYLLTLIVAQRGIRTLLVR